MKRILLHLQSKPLKDSQVNPKNYPFVKELKNLLKDYQVYEITSAIPLRDSKRLIQEADYIICVDSYLQHLCWSLDKQSIVLWGQSDPLIFGHESNINLLKNRKYLRETQFDIWEETVYNKTKCNNDAFVTPNLILTHLK